MRPGSRSGGQRPSGNPAQPSPALSAAMSGAVDLAAVKARSEAAARAAEAPPVDGEYVLDITEVNFQPEAIDRSFQVPVLLVVTSARAPGAEPMITALESLAAEANGGFVLGKVNADTDARVVQALQVQAVPTVFAVIGGRLVPGFEGVLPDDQLREFVGAVLQAAAQAGLTPGGPETEGDEPPAEAAPPEDPRFDAAEEALAEGNYELARERFQAILDAEPGNADAALALRQTSLLARVQALPATAAEPSGDDVPGQLAAADRALAGDEIDAALRRLLDLLARTSGDERDLVRERLIEYFDLLGDDERVGPARREMARALF